MAVNYAALAQTLEQMVGSFSIFSDADFAGMAGEYIDYSFSINPIGSATGACVGGSLTGGIPAGIAGGAIAGSVGVVGGADYFLSTVSVGKLRTCNE